MKYNRLGKSDLKVSEIALGTMSLPYTEIKTSEQILDIAVDAGINYIDTADLYDKGENEILLGKWLKKKKRDDLIVATKVGNKWLEDGSGWEWAATKKYIMNEVDNSLRRLQVDYIDLYQLHGGIIEDPIDEIVEAFERLKTQGKIREYGISSIRPNVIQQYLERSHIINIMMQYSLLDRRPEEWLDHIKNKGVSVVSRGGLAQGLLVDKKAAKYLDYSEEEVLQVQKVLSKLSSEYGFSTISFSLAYILYSSPLASAVIGCRTVAHINQLVESYVGLQKNPLDTTIYSEIVNHLKPQFYSLHRDWV